MFAVKLPAAQCRVFHLKDSPLLAMAPICFHNPHRWCRKDDKNLKHCIMSVPESQLRHNTAVLLSKAYALFCSEAHQKCEGATVKYINVPWNMWSWSKIQRQNLLFQQCRVSRKVHIHKKSICQQLGTHITRWNGSANNYAEQCATRYYPSLLFIQHPPWTSSAPHWYEYCQTAAQRAQKIRPHSRITYGTLVRNATKLQKQQMDNWQHWLFS